MELIINSKAIINQLVKYLDNPHFFFGDGHRQAIKLDNSLNNIKEDLNVNKKVAINEIICIAKERINVSPPTIYIHNIGSSGSHWLNFLLNDSLGTIGKGEIYIAQKFRDEVLSIATRDEAYFAMQVIMLAHAHEKKLSMTGNIVNTAHISNMDDYLKYDFNAYKVLLMRDPVDIVLSRTFRKDEYRKYLGHDKTSDNDYALINIKKVRRFMSTALKTDHNLRCHYENIKIKAPEIIQVIADDLGLYFPEEKKHELVINLANDSYDDKASEKTKRYKGDRIAVDEELLKYIKVQLTPLREMMGYPLIA